ARRAFYTLGPTASELRCARRMSLPPGPREPPLLQLAQWMFRPLPFLERQAAQHGDLFTVRLPGIGDFVFVHSPELIKQVFTADPEVLRSGQANRLLGPLLGAHSVLLLDGEPHLRQRRLLLPPFHGERMQAYATVM